MLFSYTKQCDCSLFHFVFVEFLFEGTGVEGVVPARELGVKADELEDK